MIERVYSWQGNSCCKIYPLLQEGIFHVSRAFSYLDHGNEKVEGWIIIFIRPPALVIENHTNGWRDMNVDYPLQPGGYLGALQAMIEIWVVGRFPFKWSWLKETQHFARSVNTAWLSDT